MPGPATRGQSALGRYGSCRAPRGKHRALGAPADTRRGRVSLSMRPQRPPHTAARGLREARPRLSLPGAPPHGPVHGAPEATAADGRGDRHRGESSHTPWRCATDHATTPAWSAALVDLDGAPARGQAGSARTLPPGPALPPDAAGLPRLGPRVAGAPRAGALRPTPAAPGPSGWSRGAAVRSQTARRSAHAKAPGPCRTGLRCPTAPQPCASRAGGTPPRLPTLHRRESGPRARTDKSQRGAQAGLAPPELRPCGSHVLGLATPQGPSHRPPGCGRVHRGGWAPRLAR
jgi:hypothetical protein